MKIVDAGPLFITTDAVGGVWSYSVALARGVAAIGARCVVAVVGPSAQPEQRAAIADIAGCDLLEAGLPLDWTLGRRDELDTLVLELIAQARDAGCSAAHLHAPALAAQRWPVPVVAVAHSCMATWWDAVYGGTAPASIAWHHNATADGMANADATIAPTQSFSAALTRVYHPARPIHVVHNGLPERASAHLRRNRTVLTAGRLWDAGKNVAVLDAAAAMLDMPIYAAGASQAPDGSHARFTHLHVIGVKSSAALQSLMADIAIFAAPSLYEPFGLAVLEAAQQATALVLSDIPTFRELWSDAAVFVRPDDAKAWADAILDLANDPGRIAKLGQAALMRSRRYTQDRMVSATMAVHRRFAKRALRAA